VSILIKLSVPQLVYSNSSLVVFCNHATEAFVTAACASATEVTME